MKEERLEPEAPLALFELQKWTVDLITRPFSEKGPFHLPIYEERTLQEIEERITPGPRLSAAQRIGIYNQQHWLRFFAILQEHYPALTRLFGCAAFNEALAEPYLAKYYPWHWLLSPFGSRLPQWIEEEYRDEDRELVWQVALVEEAYERIYHCRAVKPLCEEDLSRIAKEPLYLQPIVVPLALSADFFAFRRMLLEHEIPYWEEHDFPALDTAKKGYFTLFWSGEGFFYEEISEPEYILLTAFEEGELFEKALELVCQKAAAAREWFQKWAERKWLSFTRAVHPWVEAL